MKVKIKENSVVAKIAANYMKADRMAIVFGKTIHLHNTSVEEFLQNTSWVKHEVAHVLQYKQKGYFRFILSYLLNTYYSGYENNLYELDAKAKEKSHTILNNVEFIDKYNNKIVLA